MESIFKTLFLIFVLLPMLILFGMMYLWMTNPALMIGILLVRMIILRLGGIWGFIRAQV